MYMYMYMSMYIHKYIFLTYGVQEAIIYKDYDFQISISCFWRHDFGGSPSSSSPLDLRLFDGSKSDLLCQQDDATWPPPTLESPGVFWGLPHG